MKRIRTILKEQVEKFPDMIEKFIETAELFVERDTGADGDIDCCGVKCQNCPIDSRYGFGGCNFYDYIGKTEGGVNFDTTSDVAQHMIDLYKEFTAPKEEPFEVGDRVLKIAERYEGKDGVILEVRTSVCDCHVDFGNGITWYCRNENLKQYKEKTMKEGDFVKITGNANCMGVGSIGIIIEELDCDNEYLVEDVLDGEGEYISEDDLVRVEYNESIKNIHVDTEEEKKVIFDIFTNLGYTWYGGENPHDYPASVPNTFGFGKRKGQFGLESVGGNVLNFEDAFIEKGRKFEIKLEPKLTDKFAEMTRILDKFNLFEDYLEELKKSNGNIEKWLEDIEPEYWIDSGFSWEKEEYSEANDEWEDYLCSLLTPEPEFIDPDTLVSGDIIEMNSYVCLVSGASEAFPSSLKKVFETDTGNKIIILLNFSGSQVANGLLHLDKITKRYGNVKDVDLRELLK